MQKLIIFLLYITVLQSANLSVEQLKKLKKPVAIIQNDTLIIEEYNKITFTQDILFGGINTKEIIVKTYSTMKKDIIHREQFIAISSTASDQLMQSVIFLPEYHQYIKNMELLIDKPINLNLTIELHFLKDGIKTKIYNKNQNIEKFIPFNELFLSHMR